MPKPISLMGQSPWSAACLLTLALAPSLGQAASNAASGACGTRSFVVYFEEYKSNLDTEGQRALAASQKSFTGCQIEHVRIVGLAGSLGGTQDQNQKLSEQRAQTIADLLVAGGWPRDRVQTVAVGDKNAKAGDADKPIRRRVRVEVDSHNRS